MQPGDVPVTHAAMDEFAATFGYRPETALGVGVARFAAWFKEYANGRRSLTAVA